MNIATCFTIFRPVFDSYPQSLIFSFGSGPDLTHIQALAVILDTAATLCFPQPSCVARCVCSCSM